MGTAKEHIEEIRRSKFSIGGEPNQLTEDLHQAVKNLSAELYAKDVHFLMELIQNAEDNEYDKGVDPSLEFVITSKDITETGAQATLLIFNNEKGFSRKNIESICSVGRSTKKGNRKKGYIGEKGIGFKSVFLITARPYIFSNGYQIRFNEEPCQHCNVGYIVPEWVEANPTLPVISQIYGSSATLPATTLVLPLKFDKVKPVKQQLSSIHPEVLLFLSKIKKLSVREDNEDPRLNTVSAISISSETEFVEKKNIDAKSYLLHLSANKKSGLGECSYYMWKQKFPVKREHRVDRRMEVDEWVITLAFPNGKRLNRGTSSPGIYAFLPTEMVTNFPFIIQADFLLASSRETILLDNIWNQGILDCVPTAFVNAFTSLVRAKEGAPVSTLTHMFGFLPVNESPFPILNGVRDSIKGKLLDESIIPCESYVEQQFFQKPSDVGRLFPAFWNLLNKARKQGVVLHNISSHGRFIVNSAFDKEMYNHILNFLEVKQVDNGWYAKCIQSSNLVLGVSEDVYLELLAFVAEKWLSSFKTTEMMNIQLLKYVDFDDDVALCSIYEALNGDHSLLLSRESGHISWLINWNSEFRFANHLFFAKSTQEAVQSHSRSQTVLDWLKDEVKVCTVNVHDYALLLLKSQSDDRKIAVAFTHFLHQSLTRLYLSREQVAALCSKLPLVDNYGQVTRQRKGVLVPANGSKWVQLIGSNPWRHEGYVELGEDYLHSGSYAGVSTSKKELVEFLRDNVAAIDIPDLPPPDAAISSMSSPLTKENALLLLEWIRKMNRNRVSLPTRFLSCIKEGSWLKVLLSGSPGDRPPSKSFFHTSSWGHLLQNGSVIVDIPLVDQGFYGSEIEQYKEELSTLGVMFEFKEACEYIGEHFMSLATSSTLTKGHVVSILNFIKYLKEKCLPADTFVNSINDRRWLRTTQGEKSPRESVFFDGEWNAASQISDIPFIDHKHYGDEILSFKTELKLLGVVYGFNQNYELVVDNLRSPARLGCLTTDAFLLILECIRHLSSFDKICRAVKDRECMKTINMGYKCPTECFLLDPEWGCLLQVFPSFPLIDTNFYGSSILSYKSELQKLGVVVTFEAVTQAFVAAFKKQTSSGSLNKDSVLSLLACYRKLKTTSFKFPSDLKKCIQEAKWLRTRIGDKVPKDCIIFDSAWESISSISLLPFIDDSEARYGKSIHEYKDELKSMGVTVTFASGAKFVPESLRLPEDPSAITVPAAFSLLECLRTLEMEHNDDQIATLRSKLARKWMRTNAGYRSPGKCLLFGPQWNPILQPEDGPFIDDKFYGSKIGSYKKELQSLGVVVEIGDGCSLLADYLDCHSNSITITRIYKYLSKFNWEPTKEGPRNIRIPNGVNDGEWVNPDDCVLYDKSGFFGLQLHVLEKHYDKELLSFFSKLGVKSNPSLDDFLKLWKSWVDAGRSLAQSECQTFWEFIVKHCSSRTENFLSRTENFLSENLSKLPAGSGLKGILMLDKRDVFIADDLYLKDLFEHSVLVNPNASAFYLFVREKGKKYSSTLEKGLKIGAPAIEFAKVGLHPIDKRRLGLFPFDLIIPLFGAKMICLYTQYASLHPSHEIAGIGFKSVFLITARPYIFSNGYQTRFSEEPCQHCNVGYIVPEWVEANPTLSVIRRIYGSSATLPATTVVLPLKSDKVKPVKQQLSSIHPEVLLFLSKIKKLSVREDNEDPSLNTVSAISFSSSETDFVKKNIDAESYLLHLSADEKSGLGECSYYMWKQKFPVRREHRVDRRMDVDEWVITLAFPNGELLNRGTSSPGIYAILPTEMVTNFPFIIQADFLLASSRETILLDDIWNQGILGCVPSAFVNAFTSLVRANEGAPVSTLTHMFGFLPVNASPFPILNGVRDSIKGKLLEESIIPCESYVEQQFFQKPNDVGRLFPAFWNLLNKARKQGVVLHNISSHGKFIINSDFDKEMYRHILNFLEVKQIDNGWYAKCIQSSNLILGVSEDVYLELLAFVAEKWLSSFKTTEMMNIQLLKYVDFDDDNFIFSNRLFFAKSTQAAVRSHSKGQTVIDWLTNEVNVCIVNVHDYALLLLKSLSHDRKIVVAFTHFLYQSLTRNYLSREQVAALCSKLPLVDNYGRVTRQRKGVMVPANGSKWVRLIGSNPWRHKDYVELGKNYTFLTYLLLMQ
ncbi:uncharacterized protein LOC132057600 [Lycium ferocissimum]|uniref:uncharacterized protein LOC132057600 n=1 Tax=Lycium ferocissimum TaxID=112874 RepID=UPI002815226C|nr:uncharacterized protein LOC132057600 [Lycium ferocissimum]